MPAELDRHVAQARAFNRWYTQKLGVLDEGLLDSDYSLVEVRVLYELAHRARPTASALGAALDLDGGYLSRILRGFERRGLIARRPDPADARLRTLALTDQGRRAFAPLDRRSSRQMAALLQPLGAAGQARLAAAMETIRTLLDPPTRSAGPYLLRDPRPGDIGWIIHRHGVLYAAEYGWGADFEALVAEIAARFLRRFKPGRERCWIAERDGAIAGCVFVVEKSAQVAQLRMLLVEPGARGLGIGRRLVRECVDFARASGYRKLTLWTNSVLHAARKLYVEAGFALAKEERHRSFGHDLVGQNWDLDLRAAGARLRTPVARKRTPTARPPRSPRDRARAHRRSRARPRT